MLTFIKAKGLLQFGYPEGNDVIDKFKQEKACTECEASNANERCQVPKKGLRFAGCQSDIRRKDTCEHHAHHAAHTVRWKNIKRVV